jgi:ATP-dependent helicase Lhr and Lhr-like helicase
VLTPGLKAPALTGNRLVYRDGVPVAALIGGNVEILTELDEATEWEARKRLLRSAASGMLADLA